jgi:hypothetical protein
MPPYYWDSTEACGRSLAATLLPSMSRSGRTLRIQCGSRHAARARSHLGLVRHAWWPGGGLVDLFLGRWTFGSVHPSRASLEHAQVFMRELGARHANGDDRNPWRTWGIDVDGEIASPLCYRNPVEIDDDASICLEYLMRLSSGRKTELCRHDALSNEERP